jgi:hypothetical protein
MFAFVDETGNTGRNLFDEAQPDFFSGALITKSNFDLVYRKNVQAIAAKYGQHTLHANALGPDKIDKIAPALLKILKKADARLFISRVEKKYLLATKVFDTLFDSGENAAVPWHIYNVRPLRIMLAFKVALLVDLDIAQRFWNALLEKNETLARTEMVQICTILLQRVSLVPDVRSQEIISEGLNWITQHPETIHFHNDSKLARNGHMPNMVAFANLLDGLENFSKRWDRPVRRITHDKQSEFEATLKFWHEMFSHASPEPISLPGETAVIQKVVESQFQVATDDDSPGIQIIDVILWLYLQIVRGKFISRESARLMNFAFKRAWMNDFSFDGVDRRIEEQFGEILRGDLIEEQADCARRMIAESEQQRLVSMKRYEQDGIVPYMRPREIEVTQADVIAED